MTLHVSSTRLPAALLRQALRRFAVPLDSVAFDEEPLDGPCADGEPPVVLIQAGGINALEQLGVKTDRLLRSGAPVERVLILGAAGHAVFSLESRVAGRCPLWVAPAVLREALGQAEQTGEANRGGSHDARRGHVRRENGPWHRVACQGILLHMRHGCLAQPYRNSTLIWDGHRAVVGVCQFTGDTLFLYAVPKQPTLKTSERETTRIALDEAPDVLRSYVQRAGELRQAWWFPLEWIGYRPCWDGQQLRWGAASLRLHPFSGQFLSYWAIQSMWLAKAMARRRRPAPAWFQHIDQASRSLFSQHVRTMQYYMRPTAVWRMLFHPYTWALRHSVLLRSRVVRRVSVL